MIKNRIGRFLTLPFVQVKGRTVPCKGILFDKDGTLLHFMALWGGWADYVLKFMEERLGLMGAGFTRLKSRCWALSMMQADV